MVIRSTASVPAPGSGLLHELFEAQAERTPGAMALIGDGLTLTYAELRGRVRELAERLRGLGVGPEVTVGVFLHRSVDLVVSQLAAFAAGGVYVPLDPDYPADRLAFMLEDSGCAVLVTRTGFLDRLPPGHGAEVVTLDRLPPSTVSATAEARAVLPGNLAYLIYTSGSTGRPKAVGVSHGAAAGHCLGMARLFGLGPGDRILFFVSPSFDIAIEEVLPALISGAAVAVRGAEPWEPAELTRRIGELGLSIVDLPTAFWHAWVRELDRANAPVPGPLRLVMVGGEAMSAPVALLWQRTELASVRLLNGYGPTEAVVTATVQEVGDWRGDGAAATVPIGGSLSGRSDWVLDEAGRPLPDGEPGELLLGGPLARGYLGHPGQTADRFVPDPFSGVPGARLYRTGDLVRRLPGGELEFLGRVDGQVKIRGFRIETGEVEAALARHPGVEEAAVVARGPAEGLLLAACVVPRAAGAVPAIAELRSVLLEGLPEHMVPALWAFLESLPLTPNGKVDRRALSLLNESAFQAGDAAGFVAPRTQVEEEVAGIWEGLLGAGPVGAHDNFFDLGGHSLLATGLASRVRQIFGVELDLRGIFAAPTLERLAALIETLGGGDGRKEAPPILPRRGGEPLPLSFAQQRLWFLDRFQPGSSAYNLPAPLRIRGPLWVAALAAALQEIVRRHEALRTTFPAGDGGQPEQVVAPPGPLPLPGVDLSGLPDPSREAESDRLAHEEGARPFDLARGPLARWTLVRLGGEEHRLLLTMHHIVSDGWSIGVLFKEIGALYDAFSRGKPSLLPELPVQVPDFVLWQRGWLAGPVLEEQLAYWRERLAGHPPALELPTDRPRPALQSFRGAALPFQLPAVLFGEIDALSRREGATLFMTLFAAFRVLLQRYTGQDDLLVGSPIANRNRVEIEGLIGFFVNTLVLRTDLSGDPTFAELLARVREAALGAYAHQDLPFEKIVEELAPERDLSRNPLAQVVFLLHNAPMPPLALGSGLTLESEDPPVDTAKFDLSLGLEEAGGELVGAAEYATDLFDGSTIRRMLGHFRGLLTAAVADPGARISELPLLSPAERFQVLVEWNPAPVPSPRETVPRLVAARAAEHPEAVAISGSGGSLTYGGLAAKAGGLARRLRAAGVGPERVVAIFLERSAELVIGALAVLEAGGAYLPIDPLYPAERVAFLLEDSGTPIVLTRSGLLGSLPGGVRAVALDRPEEEWDLPAGEDGPPAEPENLAYVIYTSGSTGRPKGVAVQHASLAHLVAWHGQAYGVTGEDRASLLAGPAFDASVWELWPCLAAGARVLVPDEAIRLSSARTVEWLREERVTLCFLPTPLAEAALEQIQPGDLPDLRALLTGGDRLHRSGRPELPVALFNHYGPTESTVVASWGRVAPDPWRDPPIGRPLPGLRIHLLDRRGEPAPAGVPGELHIGGAGLARGYVGRPGLTVEKFVPDPFAALGEEPGARLYRTGDLARYLPGGEIEFLGRADHQVKIRGIRIELGEIESVLGELEDVREAAVLVRGARLVAIIASPAPLDAGKLRDRLAERLPEALVPSAFVFLEALPLTPNGKVDRRALEAIEPPAAGRREEGSAAPRTPVEEVLAGIWSRVLGVEKVGAQDDFFLLGGHSLLATQVLSRVRQAFGVDLAVRALFEHRTLAGLARRIEEARREDQGIAGPPLVPREAGAGAPASFSQARLWFLDRLQPGTALYNIPIPLLLEGPLRAAPLARALDEIVRRHEVLRTTFAAAGGEPVQVIHPFVPRGLPAIDLTALPDGPRRGEAGRLLAEEAARPFDLAAGPLSRAALLKTGATEHVLAVSFHHIAADGWSVGVFLDELLALYRAFAAGESSPLPELAVQYADFAAWQRLWLSGEALENQLRYWRGWSERFGGTVPVLDLPGDRPRPPVQTFRGAAEPIALSAELSERLRSLARDREATSFMALLAGFQALLHRYTGQRHILVGTPIANRNREETEPLIGFFVNTLVIHAGLARDLPGAGLLDQVREEALGAYAHQDLPFEKLVEELQPERDLSRTPLFQVAFALNAPMPARELAPGLSLEVGDSPLAISKVDLSISFADEPEGFRGMIEYSTDLFDAATVHRLTGHYRTLLEGFASAPETALGALPLLTPEESQQILTDWSRTGADHGAADPVARFEALAAAWPEEPAVVAGEVSWSYGGLNRRANRLAWRLRRLGVGPETIVAVLLERSPELCAAVLGVAKAGGAHLLLDPSLPDERIDAVLEDAGVRVVVTRKELADRLPPGERDVLSLDADAGLLAAMSATNPEPLGDPENLAYVIFTSGSTGRPKGVAVERRTLANLVAWHHRVWPAAPGDRASLMAGLAFDAVVWELWAFLTGGAALVIPEEEARVSPSRLAVWLSRARITHAFLPTPLAEALLAEPAAAALPLRVLLTGGDRLHRVARQDLAFPVANHYGPTESTVVATFLPDIRLEPADRDPSIGRPIDNLRVYLLDPGLRPVPVGVPGELYIAGAGLARGYLGQPGLTAASFLPDPFGPPGARMYRSGDLARFRGSGDVEILGRIDHQVKIRGFRIELTEIELALTRHPAVRQAAVLVQEQGSAGRRLVAYLAAGSGAPDPAGWKDLLRRSLPDYMVPGAFVLLPDLPLTANGKVDRKALLAIAPAFTSSRKEHVAPRTPLEELVAEIWRDSLGAERVGVHDSFWDLGGHSLLATRVLARVEEELGLDLPIQAIFEAPVLADFTAVLGRAALAELAKLSEEEARVLLS
jgi:amino acid adenylation domain-containing protein